MAEMFEVVAEDAQRSDEALIDEVHLLEDLVERMRRRLDEQGEAPAFPAHLGGDQRQAPGLLETVREALTENRVDLFLQPIVALPQRRTQFYESFSRLRDESGRR